MASTANRKKVRGWKRQVRRVETWRRASLDPAWGYFERSGSESVRIQVDPWNRLMRRQPPVWLCRRMAHALLDVHEAWAQAASGRRDVRHLQLWLAWPHFVRSQVVMAADDRYQGLFQPTDRQRDLPQELGRALLERLSAYSWREHLWEDPVWSDGTAAFDRWLLRQRHRAVPDGHGGTYHMVQRGHVWLCELRPGVPRSECPLQ